MLKTKNKTRQNKKNKTRQNKKTTSKVCEGICLLRGDMEKKKKKRTHRKTLTTTNSIQVNNMIKVQRKKEESK